MYIFFRTVSSSALPILFITMLRNVLLLNFKSSPLVWTFRGNILFYRLLLHYFYNAFMKFNFLFKHHPQIFLSFYAHLELSRREAFSNPVTPAFWQPCSMVSSANFAVKCLIFRSLTHFNWYFHMNCTWYQINVQLNCFAFGCPGWEMIWLLYKSFWKNLFDLYLQRRQCPVWVMHDKDLTCWLFSLFHLVPDVKFYACWAI